MPRPLVVATSIAVAALSAAGSLQALGVDTPLGRWDVGGYGEGYAVFRTDPSTPSQDPMGIFALTLTGDVHPAARLFVDTRFAIGGPPKDPDGLGIYNLSDTFQNIDPAVEIEEGYLDLFLGPVDLRLGKQKFAWGKLDSFQPTDLLNPRRYSDPFLVREKEAKIGIPALQATYFPRPLGSGLPTDLSLSVVWVPVPISTRFPLERERWFPPATNVQGVTSFSLPLSKELSEDIFLQPELQGRARNTLQTENRRPPHQLDEGAVGVRLGGLYRSADWALYYYDGPETLPAFDLSSTALWTQARDARRRDQLEGFLEGFIKSVREENAPLPLHVTSSLLPRFDRIRLVGADMAVERAGFTLRAEGAYGWNRLLPRTVEEVFSDAVDRAAREQGPEVTCEGLQIPKRLCRVATGKRISIDSGDLFKVRDTVDWGMGVDYLYRGWMPLVQLNQTVIVDNDAELLVSDVDTRLLLTLRKSFFAERLEMEVSAIQGLARGYTTGIARFTYELTDNLRLRLGYVLIAGSRRTLIGQFHDNDQGFAELRYSY